MKNKVLWILLLFINIDNNFIYCHQETYTKTNTELHTQENNDDKSNLKTEASDNEDPKENELHIDKEIEKDDDKDIPKDSLPIQNEKEIKDTSMNIWEKLGLLSISIIGFIGIFFLIKYLIKINKNKAPNIVNNEPNIANDNINYNSIFGDLDNLIIDLAATDSDFIELIKSSNLQNSFTTSDNKNYQLKIPLITQHFFDKNEKLEEFINLITEFFNKINSSVDSSIPEIISQLEKNNTINISSKVTVEKRTTIRIQFQENLNYSFDFLYNESGYFNNNFFIYDQNQQFMFIINLQINRIIYCLNKTMNIKLTISDSQFTIIINNILIKKNFHGTDSNQFILDTDGTNKYITITEKNDEQLKNIVLLLQNIFNINKPTDIEDQ